ncbi:MAG TPA: aspartyl protease family protein [Steroidobacteraceae bacterium]|nr:aspartyl protease family protein [Steroidobacteraceae bacterium]
MDGNFIHSVRQKAPTGTEDPRASWSRRRFVAQGLLSIAAGSALARAGVPPARENPPDLGTAGDAADAGKNAGSGAVRSASETDNRLTTAVYINGRGPYRFLVDTGAERSLLAAEIAAELNLPRGAQVLIQGIIRGQEGSLAETQSLRMGTLVCPPLEVPTLPRAMLKVDGFLGLDVLDRHRVVFDFRSETLTVARPQGFFSALWGGANEAVVHTLGRSGRLRASNCRVNGIRAAAFVDSGAEVSVLNPALYAALRARAPAQEVTAGPVGLYGVTGGMMEGLAINIDKITLGTLNLTYTPMVVAGLEVFDLWGLSREPALLFGMDCLRRFARVSIDYGRKELRFEVASTGSVRPTLEAGLSPPLDG